MTSRLWGPLLAALTLGACNDLPEVPSNPVVPAAPARPPPLGSTSALTGLVVLSPADGTTTREPSVALTVSAPEGETLPWVRVGKVSLVDTGGGVWRGEVPLEPGANALFITAPGTDGGTRGATLTVRRDAAAPGGVVRTPREGRESAVRAQNAATTDTRTSPQTFESTASPSTRSTAQALALQDGSDSATTPADATAVGTSATSDSVTSPAPTLSLSAPQQGGIFGTRSVPVYGTVTGGTLPLAVTVNGLAASVSERSFSLALALPEGAHAVSVRVTDADGRVSDALREVLVDHTAPYLAVTRPGQGTVTVSESPYSVEGEVGDVNLAGVTVQGRAAQVLGGRFSVAVPLAEGAQQVEVVAIDLAGNTSVRALSITVDGAPPRVTLLAPTPGFQSPSPIVRVRARVESPVSVTDVFVGAGNATLDAATGEYVADVPLALGENTVRVTARDVRGLTGSAEVRVRYRDASTEPLTVTGVLPDVEAVDVRTDALVSVAFNKAVVPESARAGFRVLYQGKALPGGYSVAPGHQTVSFIPDAPLPSGEQVEVRVSGVAAAVGPGQATSFTSRFTVARPPTVLSGHVVDDGFRPLPGVRVVVESTGEAATTAADGNWALVTGASGSVVLRYEGATTPTGKLLPTVRRRVQAEKEKETRDSRVVLTPIDVSSVSTVETFLPQTLDFAGRHGELALVTPAEALRLPSGLTRGTLTATRLEPVALPMPMDTAVAPTALWQVGPVGAYAVKQLEIHFPNVSGLPAGRWAAVLAHDPIRHVVTRRGLARVSPDGVMLRTEGPWEVDSLEVLGYAALTAEQSAALDTILDTPTPGASTPDGGTLGRYLPRAPEPAPVWRRVLGAITVGDAYAQGDMRGLNIAWAIIDALTPSVAPVVKGTLRTPQDRLVNVELTDQLRELLETGSLELREPLTLDVSFVARREKGAATDPRSSISAYIEARTTHGEVVKPPDGQASNWTVESGSGADELPLSAQVVVRPDRITDIALMARLGTASTGYVLRVKPRLMAMDAGVAGEPTYLVELELLDRTGTQRDLPFQSVVRLGGSKVTLTSGGPDVSQTVGKTGEFYIPAPTGAAGGMGIVCAEIPIGPMPVLGDDGTGGRVLKGHSEGIASACSSTFDLYSGQTTTAYVPVDVRLFHGGLHFLTREGKLVERRCEPGETSEYDPDAGVYTAISDEDLASTEVHFFRADRLDRPIARFTVGYTPTGGCEMGPEADGGRPAQARYSRLRTGPVATRKALIRKRCYEINPALLTNPEAALEGTLSESDAKFYEEECRDGYQINFLRLSAGDPMVVFAVNHATGYTGMTRFNLPPISRMSGLSDAGVCEQDVREGPLKVREFGEEVELSHCAAADLAVHTPVYLFPPEIDMRVWRSAKEGGTQRSATPPPMLVRHGGAATTRDDYVHIDTHWRVRTMVPWEWRETDGGFRDEARPDAPEGAPDAGMRQRFDGGTPECRADGGLLPDGGVEVCKPGMLVDDGESGWPLETCEAYDGELDLRRGSGVGCFRAKDLDDVPAGVPPLAGRVIQVTQSATGAPTVAQFAVKPGRGSAAVEAATTVVNARGERTKLSTLTSARYYIHVVGHEVLPRDRNEDGTLQEEERKLPPANFAAPDPKPEGYPDGLPEYAVDLKNVYLSRDYDGEEVLRYDRGREHEFRVVDLKAPRVEALSSLAGTRSLSENEEAEAEPEDYGFRLLLTLLEPGGTAHESVMQGDYVVRFGSDHFGIDCKLSPPSSLGTLTGTCDSEFVDEVLSASDLLYMELYLSGNATNALYRYNLQGIAPRRDYLKAGSAYTAEAAVALGPDGRSERLLRSVGKPAIVRFALEPAVFTAGRVRVCTDEACQDEKGLVQDAQLETNGLALRITNQLPNSKAEYPLYRLDSEGARGATLFAQGVPSHLVEMPGAETKPSSLYLVLDAEKPRARRVVERLGVPKGRYESRATRAPGQMTVAGMNVADGHLALTHQDFEVPQLGETMQFSRSYDNQSGELTPVGNGWSSNFDGQLLQEMPGRYTMILGGQAHHFPSCEFTVDEKSKLDLVANACRSDGSHGMQLTIVKDPSAGEPDRRRASVRTADGHAYEFRQLARGASKEHQWRLLLWRTHVGYGRSGDADAPGKGGDDSPGWTYVTYVRGTNLIDKVERKGGHLSLEFAYETIGEENERVPFKIRLLAKNEGFAFIDKVTLWRNNDRVLYEVDLDHDDYGNLLQAKRTPKGLVEVQQWDYAYQTPRSPAEAGSYVAWRLSNEMVSAALSLSPTDREAVVQQWANTYERGASREVYPHQKDLFGEIVTGVRGSNTGPGWTMSATSGNERRVSSPDALSRTIGLNEYGNPIKVQVEGGAAQTTSWGSDVRGGPVQVARMTTAEGRSFKTQHNDRLQLLDVTSPEVGTVVSFGRPVGGGPASSTAIGGMSVSHPRDSGGKIKSAVVSDRNGVLSSSSTTYDEDGVPRGGTDQFGNVLVYGNPDALGLPQRVDVGGTSFASPDKGGGLPGYSVERVFDDYGRQTVEHNLALGTFQTWAYDGVGRLRAHTVSGTADQPVDLPQQNPSLMTGTANRVTQYFYELRTNSLRVWETTSNGRGPHSRLRTWQYSDGIKVFETFAFGGDGRTASIQYVGYEGTRLVRYLDEMSRMHEFGFDSNWHINREYVNGFPVAGYLNDADGRVRMRTDANGLVSESDFDLLGRPIERRFYSFVWPNQTQIEATPRDLSGAVTERNFGVWDREYASSSSQPQRLHALSVAGDALGKVWGESSSGATGSVSWTARYDTAGRVVRRTDQTTGVTEEYGYNDALGRQTWFKRTVATGVGSAEMMTETRNYSSSGPGRTRVEIVRKFSSLDASGSESVSPRRPDEVRTVELDVFGNPLKLIERVTPREGGTEPQLAVQHWSYDAFGREVLHVDAMGRETVHRYDEEGNLLERRTPHPETGSSAPEQGVTTMFGVNADGSIAWQEVGPHPRSRWDFHYDDTGRIDRRTLTTADAPAEGWAWRISYPGQGMVVEVNPEGHETTRQYNAMGQVERIEVREKPKTAPLQTVLMQYDGPFLRHQERDEEGSKHTVDRSAEGAIDDLGRTWTELETWDSGEGLRTHYTTQTEWTGLRARTRETWVGAGLPLTTHDSVVVFNPAGGVSRRAVGTQAELTPDDITDIRDFYADAVLKRDKPAGFGTAEFQYTYDSASRLTQVDFGTEKTLYTYELDGRPFRTVQPDGRVREVVYTPGGAPRRETYGLHSAGDGTLAATWFEAYNALGQAERVVRGSVAAGSAAEARIDAETWHYGWGARGELKSVTLPQDAGRNLARYQYAYDGLAQLVQVQFPEGATTQDVTFSYDALGRQTRRERGVHSWVTEYVGARAITTTPTPLNETITRLFDGRGRVVRETFAPASGLGVSLGSSATTESASARDLTQVDYSLDGLGRPHRILEKHFDAADVESEFFYDARDLLWIAKRGGTTEAKYEYWPSGALRSLTGPSGRTKYTVDEFQRLESLEAFSKGTENPHTTLRVEWESGGQRLRSVGNASMRESYCYDLQGRIAWLTHDPSEESCERGERLAQPVARYEYAYDGRGNRLSERVQRGSGPVETTQYGYDRAGRLTGIRYPSQATTLFRLASDGARSGERELASFQGSLGPTGFDDAATLPMVRDWTYSYDATGGVKSIDGPAGANVATYLTDAAGRVTSETRQGVERRYHFDAGGRLVRIAESAQGSTKAVSYRYDYAGLRRSRTLAGEESRYIWSGGQLLEEQLASGPIPYHAGAGMALVAGTERILHDGLGSAVARIPAGSTTPSASYAFDAYGAYRGGAKPTSGEPSVGYTGHSWDDDAGLVYAQQRWLDPKLGRFLSLDPVGAGAYVSTPNELNPWLYARGNPLMFTDPDGRCSLMMMDYECAQIQEEQNKQARETLAKARVAADTAINNTANRLADDGYPNSAATVATVGQVGTGVLLGVPSLVVEPDVVVMETIDGIKTLPGRFQENCSTAANTWSGDGPTDWNAVSQCAGATGEGILLAVPVAKGVNLAKPRVGAFGRQLAADVADDAGRVSAAVDNALNPGMVTPEGVVLKVGDNAAASAPGGGTAMLSKGGGAPSAPAPAAGKGGRTGKQKRLRELADDDKVSSANRGWLKNELRHIKTGNRKTIRLPGNSRNSRPNATGPGQGPGKELAHRRGKAAKDGNSYEHSDIQDADLHKLQHEVEGY